MLSSNFSILLVSQLIYMYNSSLLHVNATLFFIYITLANFKFLLSESNMFQVTLGKWFVVQNE